MKVVCGGCQAKYQVSDERVAGKKLKIKCRRCAHTIIVRGDTLTAGGHESGAVRSAPPPDQGAAGSQSPQASPESVLEWFASVDGSEHGPMDRGALIAWLEAHPGAWEAYVWREGFAAWKVAREVPELLAAAGHDQRGGRGHASAPPSAEGADWDDDAEPTRMLKLHMPRMNTQQGEGLAAAGVGHRASVSAFGTAENPAEDYGRMRAAGGVSFRHSSPGTYGSASSSHTMSGGYGDAVGQDEAVQRAIHHSGFRQTGERRYTPAPTEDYSIDESADASYGGDAVGYSGDASGGYVDRSFAGEPHYPGASAYGSPSGYGAQADYASQAHEQMAQEAYDGRGYEAPHSYEGAKSNYPDLYRDPAYSSAGGSYDGAARASVPGEPSLFDRSSQKGHGSAPPMTPSGEPSQPPELIDIHSLGNGGLASAQLPLHSTRSSVNGAFEGGFPASIGDLADAQKARKVMPYAIMGAAATLAAAVVGVFFLLDSDETTTGAAMAKVQAPSAPPSAPEPSAPAASAEEGEASPADDGTSAVAGGEYDEPAAPPAARRRRGVGVGAPRVNTDSLRDAENRARLDALNRGESPASQRGGEPRPAMARPAPPTVDPTAEEITRPEPQEEPSSVPNPKTVNLPPEPPADDRRQALSDDPMAGLESDSSRGSGSSNSRGSGSSGDALDVLLDGVKAPSSGQAAPSAGSEGGRSIDDLLSGAVQKGGEPAPAVAADLPEQPDRDDVLRALKSVTPRVQRCATGAGVSGTAKVTLTVDGTTGAVASALVSGVEGPASDCIKREVQTAKFPKFKKSKFNITFPFRLQ